MSPSPLLQNALSRLLFERGWSDAELATRTGLSRPRVNRLKNRRARPSVRDALLVSVALGVPVACVFSLVTDVDPRRPDR